MLFCQMGTETSVLTALWWESEPRKLQICIFVYFLQRILSQTVSVAYLKMAVLGWYYLGCAKYFFEQPETETKTKTFLHEDLVIIQAGEYV